MSRHWIVDSLGQEPFARLARGISPSKLHAVLLEVMRERARARTPAEVLAQYVRDGFVRPTDVDQRALVALDAALLRGAEGFEAVELSPVAPLGVCSTVALTDQHRVLSALRSTEIVSDPTNVLALECATRLRREPSPVHLATCQRVIRAQALPPVPGFSQHFRIFVLASAGIETKDHGFTVDALVRHVRAMNAALDCAESLGYALSRRRVRVLATKERAHTADALAAQLSGEVQRGVLEHGYYQGLRYQIDVATPQGEYLPLIDGGAFDWVAKLTGNRRAVYVASGGGAQMIPRRFDPRADR